MGAKKLSTAIAVFSAKFCNELEKGKSVVSSPLSAEFLLALLALGTTEPAHSQLLAALGIASDDVIRSSFSQLSSQLKDIKGVTFNVANKVYIKEGNYRLQPELEAAAVNVFDAALEKVNFANGEATADVINSWIHPLLHVFSWGLTVFPLLDGSYCYLGFTESPMFYINGPTTRGFHYKVESKTNNKIKDLLSPDSFSDDTRLVLVNAIYFKGFWKKQFNSHFTKSRPFHVTKTRDVDVPMMHREGKYRLGRILQLDAEFLEIPYKGDEVSMLIVLPNDIEGLNGVLKKLADGFDLLGQIYKSEMHLTDVEVYIPKFKVETEIDLKDLLPKLGIKSIFDQVNSGITKMLDNNEPLYVSKAVQKAFIEVNEEGTEAAAATGVEWEYYCLKPVFYADRPFLYVLIGSNYITLFIGIYNGDD